jgi:hypothetical protein
MGKRDMKPWNNWYHCCGSTYGTWVRGDPRGWRARHHREHVDGDYKDPPPTGKHDPQLRRSQSLMKRHRVVLTLEQRRVACRAFGDKLRVLGVELIELCISARHWHLLARFEPLGSVHDPTEDKPRLMVGQAKGVSARMLSKSGLIAQGGVWATRCRCLPIRNRSHQVNVTHYIRRHARQGAAVYSMLIQQNTT